MTTDTLSADAAPTTGEPAWAGIPSTCACWEADADCMCDRTDQVLRLYAAGSGQRPMTAEERAYLVDCAQRAAEGALKADDLRALDDAELARSTLWALDEYARNYQL